MISLEKMVQKGPKIEHEKNDELKVINDRLEQEDNYQANKFKIKKLNSAVKIFENQTNESKDEDEGESECYSHEKNDDIRINSGKKAKYEKVIEENNQHKNKIKQLGDEIEQLMIANNVEYSNEQRLTVLNKLIQQLKPDNSSIIAPSEKNQSHFTNNINTQLERVKSKSIAPRSSDILFFSPIKANPKLEYVPHRKNIPSFSKTMTDDCFTDDNKKRILKEEKSQRLTTKNFYKIESPNINPVATSTIRSNRVPLKNQKIKQEMIGDFLRKNLEVDGSDIHDNSLLACKWSFKLC